MGELVERVIVIGLEHAVRPAVCHFGLYPCTVFLSSSIVFITISYSLITMSNANSSDSHATVSYGSDSDFDGFTIEEIGRTSGATAGVGKATASTSGTRRVGLPVDAPMIMMQNYLVRHRTRCGYIHVYV